MQVVAYGEFKKNGVRYYKGADGTILYPNPNDSRISRQFKYNKVSMVEERQMKLFEGYP